MRNQKLRIMVEVAVAAALTFILDLIVLYRMPQGGSVNLSMLPTIVIALRYGVKVGMVAGLIAGTISALPSPTLVHPIQFLLDYPIAYAVLGVAGLCRNRRILYVVGAVMAGVLRYFSHVLSGIVFFGEYAEGPVILYSLGYQLPYIIPSTILVSVVIGLLPAIVFQPSVAPPVSKEAA
ncbi:energy-coupled thiamine transporter ThiT [Rubeoparvulum massiliense]|uniref:energy-coupled thiamine transporter ThiT n=1 Tax=Rubeoparvulum massiliense TaxID=1631346 RepID=UPI00065DCCFD|nr:energy-coupled thiamine transporter ThiT [Rubeoparvulum massiliense]